MCRGAGADSILIAEPCFSSPAGQSRGQPYITPISQIAPREAGQALADIWADFKAGLTLAIRASQAVCGPVAGQRLGMYLRIIISSDTSSEVLSLFTSQKPARPETRQERTNSPETKKQVSTIYEQSMQYPRRDPRPDPGPSDLAVEKGKMAVGRHAACGRPDGRKNRLRASPQDRNGVLQVGNPPAA
ncbi:hypothetical protein NDU88_000810 [Pleurodeles waltl]|uniref:Uncharacterized protein n=1 Tax=Pleurodeles waltl TaxID=8319 RepID=A0AAV7V7Y5_PLEWA|nr:hypothetical protein NDU88_000810 [Pleurodeles waltl]